MALIRMIADVAYPAGLLRGDQVYDLPPGEAEAMVLIGWAEDAPDDEPVRVYEQQYDHVRALTPRRSEVL